jgi:hypothetical protein
MKLYARKELIMGHSNYENAHPGFRAAAEGFWERWITDPTFGSNISDPITAAKHEVAQIAPIEAGDARYLALGAFEKVLQAEQARQIEARREN